MAVFVSAVIVAVEAVGTVGFLAAAATAVAETGIALSVVGAATGNKDLMKVGGVMSMVGGVGSLVNAGLGAVADGVAVDAAGNAISEEAANSMAASGVEGAAGGTTDTALSAVGDSLPTTTANVADGVASAAQPGIDAASSGAANAGELSIDTIPGSPGVAPVSDTIPGAAPSTESTIDASGGTSGPAGNGKTFNDTNYGYSTGTDPSLSTTSLEDATQKAKDMIGSGWKKLSPLAQAEVAKSLLAIPGGIQKQKNDAALISIQQQRINQSSYGSAVPKFGIINKAKG